MKPVAALFFGLMLVLTAGVARAAVSPDEMLDDPVLEQRARALGQELRCLVCQNQSIDDSDAPLAKDLRKIVRERLVAGDSDEEIRQFLVARYGKFVLLKPPVEPSTWLLWAGPFVVLLAAAAGVGWYLRRNQRAANGPGGDLSEEEERRVAALLAGRRGS
jgi:cytochrome c-type biogenesis protein CcmH